MTSAQIHPKLNEDRAAVAQASQPAGAGSIPAPRSLLATGDTGQGCPLNPQAGKPALLGFSLIEVLVAVSLMSVIVLGLMATFGETQRAFRAGINQVDVMESGRSALDMIAREVEQADANGLGGSVSFYVGGNNYMLLQNLPGASVPRTNILQSLVFCRREGQQWTGIRYSVLYSNSIGTLYRYETNASQLDTFRVGNLAADALNAQPRRVTENVVNLRVLTYDNRGRLISPSYNFLTNYASVPTLNPNLIFFPPPIGPGDNFTVSFLSNALPAYVEIELGILESKTAERARGIADQATFLGRQAGKVQIFRQRIPIRNADPSVYQ